MLTEEQQKNIKVQEKKIAKLKARIDKLYAILPDLGWRTRAIQTRKINDLRTQVEIEGQLLSRMKGQLHND